MCCPFMKGVWTLEAEQERVAIRDPLVARDTGPL